jgi:hypothetical protein
MNVLLVIMIIQFSFVQDLILNCKKPNTNHPSTIIPKEFISQLTKNWITFCNSHYGGSTNTATITNIEVKNERLFI